MPGSPKTRQLQTAESMFRAFNNMSIPSIMAPRHPSCLRQILPSTLGHAPTDNATYEKHLKQLLSVFSTFTLTVNDVLEDREARRVCLWLSAKGDTLAGEYVNEYMWLLDFDESGEVLLEAKEFVDTVVNRDFWPKLAAAMKAEREKGAAAGGAQEGEAA